MQIGAQLYTVRAFTQTERDFAETIHKVAGMGYTGVQISAVGPIPAKTIADICASQGVAIIVTHTNPDRIKLETDAVIEEHRIMGADYIGIGSMPGSYRADLDGVKRFMDEYKEPARRINAAGLHFAYHNHDFEFEKFDGKLMLDYLTEGLPGLDVILDTYWVQAGGGDPAAWLRKLKGRVGVIHFKDMVMVQRERRMCEVMEGNINWPAIFDACRESGVDWAMVEQDDSYGKDPFDCLRISLNNLKGVLK